MLKGLRDILRAILLSKCTYFESLQNKHTLQVKQSVTTASFFWNIPDPLLKSIKLQSRLTAISISEQRAMMKLGPRSTPRNFGRSEYRFLAVYLQVTLDFFQELRNVVVTSRDWKTKWTKTGFPFSVIVTFNWFINYQWSTITLGRWFHFLSFPHYF